MALDARSLNNAILEEKYQMTNLDSLMEQVAETINDDKEEEVRFTSLYGNVRFTHMDKLNYIQKLHDIATFKLLEAEQPQHTLSIQGTTDLQ